MAAKRGENDRGSPSGMETLSIRDLARLLRSEGEEAFRSKFDHPWLVIHYSPPKDAEWVDPKTIETGLTEMMEEIEQVDVVRAIPLVKTDRNAFQSKITMGRAKNNDVVIRAAKISKLHAAFMQEKSGIKLIDMGSANGTTVNGNRLQKNESVKLKNGDLITLWRYVFKYYELDSFLLYLSKLS